MFGKKTADLIRRDTFTTDKELRIWKRIQRLSTHELLEYIDTAGAGMGRGLKDFREQGKIASLTEISDALLVLKVIVEELTIRCETEA